MARCPVTSGSVRASMIPNSACCPFEHHTFCPLTRNRSPFSQGVDDGSVRPDVDPQQRAVLIVSILRGLAYQWLLEPDAVDLVAAYDEIIDLVATTLAP